MGLNFLVDFLLLLGTNRLSGFPPEGKRCALGGALGALYSGACLLPGFAFLKGGGWLLAVMGLTGVAAFGWSRSALQRTGVFAVLRMALGGIAVSFGRGAAVPLVLCGAALWGLCRVGFADGLGGREYVNVELCHGERAIRVTALRDTGNSLRDPLTGENVLVLSSGEAVRLTGLTLEQLADPLETVARRAVPGLRLIPYRTVGGCGMLLAMRFAQARIGGKVRSAVVAFAAEDFGRGKVYQALTGGMA